MCLLAPYLHAWPDQEPSCSWCCFSSWPPPSEAGGHFTSSQLKPCHGLPAASFARCKASSPITCTPKAMECHCLPFEGGSPVFWGLAVVSSAACGEPAQPWPLPALENCGEALPAGTSGERAPCLYPVTHSASAALQKKDQKCWRQPSCIGKSVLFAEVEVQSREPPHCCERGSDGSGLQQRGLLANMAGMERGDRPGSELRQVTGRDWFGIQKHCSLAMVWQPGRCCGAADGQKVEKPPEVSPTTMLHAERDEDMLCFIEPG